MTSSNTTTRRRYNSVFRTRRPIGPKASAIVPLAVRRLSRLFGLPIATAILTAEAAGLGIGGAP